ncbi:E3 ubiquitin-protein ligase At4g11680-like [Olea europaea var. sylvestris]|uniref:E3 ubiquitin-protein ligase At4g11680-like n=1 Tax=Olea europaea var. sylvestris TaxID=158386 RepID=UPI000C1D416E|nr:E3 ubiquitin-protein ligase At4g11680-like [Olea europaea var. sylvestris]
MISLNCRLLVVFLAFDVFFMIFCVIMACIIFFALFFCFPILATVAYAMTIGEGASESDIMALPKYIYCQPNSLTELDKGIMDKVELIPKSDNSNSPTELALHLEDSECCICLYRYVDGVELCRLPCNHHFHHSCISKWLHINATCPLCKFNILSAETLV